MLSLVNSKFLLARTVLVKICHLSASVRKHTRMIRPLYPKANCYVKAYASEGLVLYVLSHPSIETITELA